MPIEGLHTETGPGVLEAALTFDKALEAADRAALFKTFMKVLAQRRGLMATFMAKWSNNYPGQSGHIHMSLKGKDGKAVFHDPKEPHGMSKTMRHFVGRPAGADARAARHDRPDGELLFAADPRLLGADQRHLGRREPHLRAARHPGLGQVAARRVPDRRRRLPIPISRWRPRSAPASTASSTSSSRAEPIVGNAYELKLSAKSACRGPCGRRPQRLKKSKAARELFGDDFVEHYAATREWEEREFRKHITDWELARYFEII